MNEDEINRIAFADASMVRELIRLLPKTLTADLNLGKLRRLPSGRARADRPLPEMPWAIGIRRSARHHGHEVLLTLAFRCTPERHASLESEWRLARLRRYLLARSAFASGELPQVLPVVVYTGAQPWPDMPSLQALTSDGLDARTRLQPNYQPLLLDASDLTAEDMRHNRAAAVLALQHCAEQERLPRLIANLFGLLKRRGTSALRLALAQATVRALHTKFGGERVKDADDADRTLRNYMEEPTMLANRITEWCEEWQQRGRAEGIRHARSLLERQATVRFDAATGQALSLLLADTADVDQLAEIGELIVAAATANQLLKSCMKHAQCTRAGSNAAG